MKDDGKISSRKCSRFVKMRCPHDDSDFSEYLDFIEIGEDGSLHCPPEQVLSFFAEAIYATHDMDESQMAELIKSLEEPVMRLCAKMEDLWRQGVLEGKQR
jgi:hypothetical protein